MIALHRAIFRPAHLTAATFKVSNELGMIHGFAGLGRLGTHAPPRTDPRACPLRCRRRRRQYFRMLDVPFPSVSLCRASSRKILLAIVKLYNLFARSIRKRRRTMICFTRNYLYERKMNREMKRIFEFFHSIPIPLWDIHQDQSASQARISRDMF